jgi:hypothetical protein
MCAVVTAIFGVCNSVRLSYLFVVTFCKCSINPITNPKPVYNHSKIMTIFIYSKEQNHGKDDYQQKRDAV